MKKFPLADRIVSIAMAFVHVDDTDQGLIRPALTQAKTRLAYMDVGKGREQER